MSIPSIKDIPEVFNQASFLLDRHLAEGRAKKVAVYFKEEAITYEELTAMANRLGNALVALEIERENRVLICLQDCRSYSRATLAL